MSSISLMLQDMPPMGRLCSTSARAAKSTSGTCHLRARDCKRIPEMAPRHFPPRSAPVSFFAAPNHPPMPPPRKPPPKQTTATQTLLALRQSALPLRVHRKRCLSQVPTTTSSARRSWR